MNAWRQAALCCGLMLSLWQVARADCRHRDPKVENVREGVQTLEELRQRLLPALDETETRVVEAVRLCAPNLLGIVNVAALVRPDNGLPIVVFSIDALDALHEMGQAMAIVQVPGVHDSYLEGYLRYRADPYRFQSMPMSAEDFAGRLGPPGLAERLREMPQSLMHTGQGAAMVLSMFVLAHEFAHHVHGDVRSPAVLAQQQEREARADRWAVAKLLQLGIDPAVASLSMLALNAIEKKSPYERAVANHPPPLVRALALVLASERVALEQPAWIERYLAPSTPRGELATRVRAYRAGLQRMRETYEKAIADEQRLERDNSFLLQRARAGATKERIALAGFLATGERAGMPKDLAQARGWMQRAVNESAPYEFDYRSDAQYYLGVFELAPGGDKATACATLRQAAAVKHFASSVYLERLVRNGVC